MIHLGIEKVCREMSDLAIVVNFSYMEHRKAINYKTISLVRACRHIKSKTIFTV